MPRRRPPAVSCAKSSSASPTPPLLSVSQSALCYFDGFRVGRGDFGFARGGSAGFEVLGVTGEGVTVAPPPGFSADAEAAA